MLPAALHGIVVCGSVLRVCANLCKPPWLGLHQAFRLPPACASPPCYLVQIWSQPPASAACVLPLCCLICQAPAAAAAEPVEVAAEDDELQERLNAMRTM